jgi:adenosylhomocysteine nucleosidase
MAEDKVRQVVEQAKHVVEPAIRRRVAGTDESDVTDTASAETTSSLVVLFPLALESGGLVDRMTDVVTTRCASFTERAGLLDGRRMVVCESGVGCRAAAQATADIIQVYRPTWIVSAGFAAALDPHLRRGQIIMPDTLVDEQQRTIEVGFQMDPAVLAATPSLHVGRLVTIDHMVRQRQEKERLAATYQAIACDMETVGVAEVCRQQQVRFLSVRVISDQLDDVLPVEVEHMLGQQTVAAKLGSVTRTLFRRPGAVKDMWKLQETALRASDRLAKFLLGVFSQLEE